MIRFSAHDTETDRPVIGVGLTRYDCEQLLRGETIIAYSDGLFNVPPVELCIIGGESDDALMQAAVDNALPGPGEKVN